MKLHAQSVPDPNSPHLVLWNTETFYELRPELAPTYRRVDVHDDSGRLIGSLVGSDDADGFTAGASAPYGGPDMVRDREHAGTVMAVMCDALEPLRASVRIRMKPPHFSQNEAPLQFALLQQGFRVAHSDLNFYVDLRAFASVDDYTASLKPPARRAIRYGEDLGLDVALLDPDDEASWFTAYEVLRINRDSKGRPMRLPLSYVRAIRDQFPGLVRMLVARWGGETVAAALVYRVGRGRDVVQYWGDVHDLAHSPMNLLVREVVRHAIDTGCDFLDLGISTDNGVLNDGLIQFKRSIGAVAELRVVLARG